MSRIGRLPVPIPKGVKCDLKGSHLKVTGPKGSLERDFDSAVTSQPFVVFDNVDSRCKWLNDRLAGYATGAAIIKRKLFTTNERIKLKPRCYIALTAHFS